MLKITLGPRLTTYILYLVFLAIALLVSVVYLPDPEYLVPLILTYVLGAMIPSVMISKRKVDLVEPLYWFSLMYYFVFLGTLYYIFTTFEESQHLLVLSYQRIPTLSIALVLFIIGFIFFCAGYFLTIPGIVNAKPIEFTWDRVVPRWLIKITIIACALIGLMNFFYISLKYPYGPLQFLLDFGIRSHRFEMMTEEVTTVGYHFMYAAVFLWLYLLKRHGRLSFQYRECYFFTGTFILSMMMMLSSGRTFNFISYVLVFSYLLYVFTPRYEKNLKYILSFFMLIFFGIVMFFFRILSSEMFNKKIAFSFDSIIELLPTFISGIMYWLIGKGNIPDIAIVMNLIDSQSHLGAPLYGKSFVAWVAEFIPTSEGHHQNIGRLLGYQWFGLPDTGLPPTIIGEMMLNFGYVFVPVGLFLVGVLTGGLYKFVRRRSNYFLYLTYLSLLFRFFFIWPKGETTNIVAAIQLFVPSVFLFGVLYIVSASVRRT